ncbi:MAG: hypothetical protein FWC61_03670 [Proteobacteria bacterium]|nr:hypothetical protein [Pseudomonadota bacterium]
MFCGKSETCDGNCDKLRKFCYNCRSSFYGTDKSLNTVPTCIAIEETLEKEVRQKAQELRKQGRFIGIDPGHYCSAWRNCPKMNQEMLAKVLGNSL